MSKMKHAEQLAYLSTDALVAQAIAWQKSGSSPNDPGASALYVLHRRSTQDVLAAATRLAKSSDEDDRIVGAGILSQFGYYHTSSPTPHTDELVAREDILQVLYAMLEQEGVARVMSAIVSAIGYWSEEDAIDRLLALTRHESGLVRSAVAGALAGAVADWSRPDDRVVAALVEFTCDSDADVRYSAVVDLVDAEIDAPHVTAALRAALSDEDVQIREHARRGLKALGESNINDE